jgi:glycosyltransferase involved in cell wall biosynthesis
VSTDLVVACTAWVDAVSRGCNTPTDRLILAALAAPEYRKVLVANPFRSAPILVARRWLGQGEPALPPGPAGRTQYTPVRIRRRDPRRAGALARTHARFGRKLERACRRLGMSLPSVITSDPFTAAFGDFSWAGPVTYFAYDDWAAHPAFRRWRAHYDAAYARIRERHIRVVAVSDVLLDRIAPEAPALVVPNGIDPDEWRTPKPPPEWFTELRRPRMLYTGVLDHRLDVDALRDVARRYPQGTIVLVGPIGDADAVSRARALPNVVVAGPVGRDDIVALTAAADVCLIPHVRSALTEAMSPLKLYEYLAAGRPVASADLPPIRMLGSRVELASDDGLADAVERALRRPPVPEHERRRFVSEHSWDRRMNDLLELASA